MAPESIAAGNDLNVFFGAVYCEMMHSELVVVGSRDSLLCSRNVTRFLVSVGILVRLIWSIDLVVIFTWDSLLCSRNETRFLVSVGLLGCLVLSIDRGKSLHLILCTRCDVGLHEGNSGEDAVVTELQQKITLEQFSLLVFNLSLFLFCPKTTSLQLCQVIVGAYTFVLGLNQCKYLSWCFWFPPWLLLAVAPFIHGSPIDLCLSLQLPLL